MRRQSSLYLVSLSCLHLLTYAGVEAGTPADVDPEVGNGSFESDQTTTWTYATTLTSWTSGYGSMYIGLQGSGAYIEQTVSGLLPGHTYWVSMMFSKAVSDTAFESTAFTAFNATGASVKIKIANSSPSGDFTVFADFVIITDGNPKLLNGDFEEQDTIDPWAYVTSVTGYESGGSRVIIKNGPEGSDWGGLDSKSGTYYFALQDTDDYIEQTVHGLSPVGTYTITFMYASRPPVCGTCLSGGKLSFFVDGVEVWSALPSNSAWATYTYTFAATTTYKKFRWENTSPVTQLVDNDKAVFIDNIVLPGTILFGDYDFETGGATGCSITSLTSWTWTGTICIFANAAQNTDGCTFDSYSGETYLSMETAGTEIHQTATGMEVSQTWVITWKMAACKAGAKLGFYIDDSLVWTGYPPTTGFVIVNHIYVATGTGGYT
eukprot:gene10689-12640_t